MAITKKEILKYKNDYGWCKYPFTPNSLGYCWGFATEVDRKESKEKIKVFCKKCEFYDN